MPATIRFSNAARQDRRRIRAWFRQPGAGAAALARLNRIEVVIANIPLAPHAHPAGPVAATRVLLSQRQRVIYVVVPDAADAAKAYEILIVRIHGLGQSTE